MATSLPKYDKRTAVIGSTGSGKTQFGLWLLSTQDFKSRPWVIFDFKGDQLIEELPAIEISIEGAPPKKPGLYKVRPLPGDEKAVSDFLMKVWAQEECGIYIDEGYMIPKMCRWFRSCLTQGRSKHIPMIILSQRPSWLDNFVFTEANFFAVFNLNNLQDRKRVSDFLNEKKPTLLPKYHCYWYDVDAQEGVVFSPCPDADTIISRFENKVSTKPVLI